MAGEDKEQRRDHHAEDAVDSGGTFPAPLFLLVGVTIYVTVGAVNDIITPPEDDVVDIFMLWLFSSLNAVVDIVSAYMFYAKGRGAFYETINDGDDIEDDDNYHILEGDEEESCRRARGAHESEHDLRVHSRRRRHHAHSVGLRCRSDRHRLQHTGVPLRCMGRVRESYHRDHHNAFLQRYSGPTGGSMPK